jgi:uncharacterized RDD family membrane protein YckC
MGVVEPYLRVRSAPILSGIGTTGQTLAMQTWKIRLSTPRGVPPTLAQLALRYALAWPSVIYLGAGLFWALFDRDRQFLHDRLAGTCLVFKQS